MVMETLPPGTRLKGRYRVERALGSGGFGHVYLAVDQQTNQQYAIKEYLVTGSSGKAQLQHEAQVLSQLHHPSMPAFQDAFDERGRYYVVLGYIEGRDLTDCIRAARQRNEIIPLERILNWLISICEVVTFLHNQRPPVIHRDIKPDNIRITPNGTAILVDLGNAKEAAEGARTLFFIRHQGTPGYAPLEQYPGGAGTDTRSDVYALGGTLFFALTAQEPPSVSSRKQSGEQGKPDMPSLQEILEQNPPETGQDPNGVKQFRLGVSKPAKPVPRHSRHLAQLGTLSPDLLNRLNLIIMRAMAMDPWDRYQSVMELRTDLQRVLAALPSSTLPAKAAVDRPIDPHSTQPDLPFLFESIQNTRGNTPLAPETAPHCPRCQAEVTRTAVFCPRCGAPLNSAPPQSNTANHSMPADMGQDLASEPTMLYTPQTPQSRVAERKPPPLPFLQSVAPAPLIIPGAKRMQPSAPVPVAVSPIQANNPQAAPKRRTGSAKFLLFFVIAIVVAIVVLVVVLFSRLKANPDPSNVTPLYQARYYSIEAQVFNYERNISFCPTSTTAHIGAGIRQCHTSIPAPAGFAERVAGPRVGSAANDYRSRFT
ncbi:MAG TPA: protein kinase [Ktedonobacteraceae bacterium]|nr:protein kinase [Ktedonobacteraceae bacterium]